MNKIQLRKKRIQIKKERLAVLREIDLLKSKLDNENDNGKRKELRMNLKKLGDKLQSLVVNSIEDHEHMENSELFQAYGRKRCAISVESYIQYKKNGLRDIDIAFECGISKSRLDEWKKRNGVTKALWKEAN